MVFVDPDVLVIGDLGEAFAVPYDYAVTISEGAQQPINGAMHFVHAQRYQGAIDIIKGVLEGCAGPACMACQPSAPCSWSWQPRQASGAL